MTSADRPVGPTRATRPARSRARGGGEVSNLTLGARGEQLAVDHLVSQGLEILDRNWRCRWGEIDIVACERAPGGGRRLVFCEVKTRSGRGYGSPLEAVTFAKMQRLRRLAGHWLEAQGPRSSRGEWADLRIDAIGVLLDSRSGSEGHLSAEPEINHVRGVG